MGAPDTKSTRMRSAQRLFSGLPARYDRLAAVLSLGQDRRWRREMIDHVVPLQPLRVLDVATGPAGVALQLAGRTPATIIGIDVTAEMLQRGRGNIAASQFDDRIELVLGQGECLPFPDESFDAVTFTYLLRYVDDPAATIAELARVVSPNGTLANLEFAVPSNPVWRWLWYGYTRLVLPIAGAALGGRPWFEVGRFLGPSISAHYRRFPVDATVDAWAAAGLIDIGVRRMSLGGGIVMWGTRS